MAIFFHISFLECCKISQVLPNCFQIRNSPFIEFVAPDLIASWENTLQSAEEQLLDILLMGIADKMIEIEHEFWRMPTSYSYTVKFVFEQHARF